MRVTPKNSVIAVIAVLVSWPWIASAQFIDATMGPMVNSSGTGLAWGDYDNDGDLDLVFGRFGGRTLLRNEGGGTFVDATNGPLGTSGKSVSVVWGDYDNDGDLDLFAANSGAANRLFRNDGGGTFVDVTSAALGDTGYSQGAAWADYDNDGDLDLYVARFGSPNKLFRNEGNGAFVDATVGVVGDAGYGLGVAWGDYDNDGDLDLFVANDGTSGSKLFRNEGHGAFIDATGGALLNLLFRHGVAWGDYDNDGDLDLVISGGSSTLFRNDGGGSFVNVTSGALVGTSQGQGMAWGDYDNDGDLDLYLVNYAEANKLLRNEGGGSFVDATSGPLGDAGYGHGTAWGDYDGDGDLDLYLTGDAEGNKLFRNEATGGRHWLQIRLEGTQSNRVGIGARVVVVSNGVRQFREISGGSGYATQDATIASFGLGTAATVESLIVRWPSGILQVVNPAAAVDQLVTVVEASTVAVAPAPDLPQSIELSPGTPNPVSMSMRIEYSLPRAARVNLSILDVQGRHVASLVDDERPAGRHGAEWRGRDQGGHLAGAGQYFVRLTVADSNGREWRTRKIILVR